MKTINSYTLQNKTRYALLLAVIFALFTFFNACGGDDDPPLEGNNISMTDLSGTWSATTATFNGTDVVAEGGSVTMTIQGNGRFNFMIERPGMDDMVFTGQLGFDEEWLAVEYDTDPGEWEYYDYDLTDGKTKFHIGANSEFDFDDDGMAEFVIFILDMVRI